MLLSRLKKKHSRIVERMTSIVLPSLTLYLCVSTMTREGVVRGLDFHSMYKSAEMRDESLLFLFLNKEGTGHCPRGETGSNFADMTKAFTMKLQENNSATTHSFVPFKCRVYRHYMEGLCRFIIYDILQNKNGIDDNETMSAVDKKLFGHSLATGLNRYAKSDEPTLMEKCQPDTLLTVMNKTFSFLTLTR